DYYCSSYIF
nr:immunoglobulin light chain junction region [Macaca mulatta]